RILSALFVIPSTHLLILSPLPLFSSLSLPPPRYTLFPYTTLFRSVKIDAGTGTRPKAVRLGPGEWRREWRKTRTTGFGNGHIFRSEEHTSELQSRENLVCRLLLEKKKKTKQNIENRTSRKKT